MRNKSGMPVCNLFIHTFRVLLLQSRFNLLDADIRDYSRNRNAKKLLNLFNCPYRGVESLNYKGKNNAQDQTYNCSDNSSRPDFGWIYRIGRFQGRLYDFYLFYFFSLFDQRFLIFFLKKSIDLHIYPDISLQPCQVQTLFREHLDLFIRFINLLF